MEASVYHISLDIHAPDSQGLLYVKRGDTARRLSMSLTQKGLPYLPGQDCFAVLTGRKADGTFLYQACRSEGEEISYDFSPQTTACPGELLCELRLYDAEGGLLTSPRFSVLVADRVYNDEEIVESADEFTALTALVAETREIKAKWEALTEQGGGLAFDSGYVDSKGLLHLTHEGEEIKDFTPFPIGKGTQGASAYEVAVSQGFEGSEEEWLESLVGPPGLPEVYIGTGDMPEGYSIQIDPEGEIPELATKAYVDSLMGNLEAELEALL